MRDKPIDCAGDITVAGEYDMDLSFDLLGELAIWVTEAICE